MDIDVEQRCLGEVDVQALSDRILAQDAAAWTEQAIRQQTYEVHKDTESIVSTASDWRLYFAFWLASSYRN